MSDMLRDLLRGVSRDPEHLEVAVASLVAQAEAGDLQVEHVLDLLRPAVAEPGRLEAAMDSLIIHAEQDPALLRAMVTAPGAATRTAARTNRDGAR